jgi:hypothetical protein
MVVGDFNVVDTMNGPREAYSVLIVYTDRMLAPSIGCQRVQLETGPRLQISQ